MKYTQNYRSVSPIPSDRLHPHTLPPHPTPGTNLWLCFTLGFGLFLRRVWFKAIQIAHTITFLMSGSVLVSSFVCGEETQIGTGGQPDLGECKCYCCNCPGGCKGKESGRMMLLTACLASWADGWGPAYLSASASLEFAFLNYRVSLPWVSYHCPFPLPTHLIPDPF